MRVRLLGDQAQHVPRVYRGLRWFICRLLSHGAVYWMRLSSHSVCTLLEDVAATRF